MEIFVNIFVSIIGLIAVLGLSFCFYILYINQKVYKFRTKIVDLCSEYDKRHEHEFTDSAFIWLYNELPTYDEMMYSFKPIRLQTYITEEQYQKLIN